MKIGSKSKIHRFVVTITMDKKCSRQLALREVRDNIHGQHYCSEFEIGDPGEFRIRSIRLAPRKAVRR